MKEKITILTTTHFVASTSKRKGYTNLIKSTITDLYEKIWTNNLNHIISLDHDESNKGSVEYLNNLKKLEKEFTNLKVITTTKGIYYSIKNLVENSTTPYYLWFEHDWEFINEMDLLPFIEVMDKDKNVNYIRFNKRSTVQAGCDGKLWEYKNPNMSLVGTNGWSNNPYFGRKAKMLEWYEKMDKSGEIGSSDDKYDPTIEVYLQKHLRNDLSHSKEKFLKNWGVFIYGKKGDSALVQHINGRNK